MNTVPFSGRLKLSDDARNFYEAHGQARGGYTRIIEKALEFYVDQGALSNTSEIEQIQEKLNNHNIQLVEIREILLQISRLLPPHSDHSNINAGEGVKNET